MRAPDRDEVRRNLRRIYEQRTDIGLSAIISKQLFEPRNPFDPAARRKLKPEILIISTYVLLMIAIWATINIR